jgi:UDP-glucose 4-epimerase
MSYPILNSKILITGGAGCLGSTIIRQLAEAGARHLDVLDDLSEGYVENLGRALGPTLDMYRYDLADRQKVEGLIFRGDYDYVIHCGGHLLRKAEIEEDRAIEVNVKGTLNVVRAAWQAGVKKLIFTSSCSVFGEPRYVPVDEAHPWLNSTVYGATKAAGEMIVRKYGREQLPYSIIRPYNIYGPRQSPKNGAFSQVVPIWLDRLATGQPMIINGDGEQTLDLVHVSDMARAHVQALYRSEADGEDFNIGSGVATSANELATLLKALWGQPDHPTLYHAHDACVVKARRCAIGKARRLLDYVPEYDLARGMAETVAWWREHRL